MRRSTVLNLRVFWTALGVGSSKGFHMGNAPPLPENIRLAMANTPDYSIMDFITVG